MNINKDLIGAMYSEAATYHYKRGDIQKQKTKKGLTYAPYHYGYID